MVGERLSEDEAADNLLRPCEDRECAAPPHERVADGEEDEVFASRVGIVEEDDRTPEQRPCPPLRPLAVGDGPTRVAESLLVPLDYIHHRVLVAEGVERARRVPDLACEHDQY